MRSEDHKDGASIVNMDVKMEKTCYAMFYRIFSAADWAPYENADEATMTALAQALDQEGWGIKNINFSQEGSYATTDYQHALDRMVLMLLLMWGVMDMDNYQK